ncbi:MAG: riboflavin synthase [Candidatus Omnitrophica bacterium]|nr:riboflavin synthase [Candidatus Omnitrophota bacterium]
MFSGIIEKQGKLIRKAREGKQIAFTFEAGAWDKPIKRGESIAVDGVCLTVTAIPNRKCFVVQAVPETLASSTLAGLNPKEQVNLERSLKWGERIGGHFVLGHVDGIGCIVKKKIHGKSSTLQIEVPPNMMQYLAPKGSIAVDGMSLTIQKILPRTMAIVIAVIPYTAKTTTIGRKKQGDRVNLEADVIAKHLAHLVQPGETRKVSIQ